MEIRNLTFDRTIETDAFDEHVYLGNCRRAVIENSALSWGGSAVRVTPRRACTCGDAGTRAS